MEHLNTVNDTANNPTKKIVEELLQETIDNVVDDENSLDIYNEQTDDENEYNAKGYSFWDEPTDDEHTDAEHNEYEPARLRDEYNEMNNMFFNDTREKVDYINTNFLELEKLLLHDDALSTILIDMINKKKYGNDFPSITKNNSYDDVKSPKKFLYTNSYSDKDENEDDDYEDDRERDNVCTIS